MASARQQIRIAIALAALRHKPSAQSIPSYILDLHSAFPVSAPESNPNRPQSPSPWRQRVLLLEKDLQELQSQRDKEQIELLALRKAAAAVRSKQTKKRTREADPAEDATDTSAPKKRGRQKRQKPTPVVCATDDAAPPTPQTEPRPQSRPELGAIAYELYGSADIPTAPAFLASLDSFDAMADMLDAEPLAVPLDLLLSTTRRALRALGALLSASLASPSCCLPGSSSRTGTGFVSTSGMQGSPSTAPDDAPSGVRHPLRALALLDASLHRVLCTVFAALAAHLPSHSRSRAAGLRGPRWRLTQMQIETRGAALDGFLGSLYELVLYPLVRAFAPASEGFVSACLLRSCSRALARSDSRFGFGSGSGCGSGSGSGISYGDEYPLPGAGGNSARDNNNNSRECDKDKDSDRAGAGAGDNVADLRPVLFDVLERAVSTLEGQCRRLIKLGSSGVAPESLAGDEESSSGSGSGPANAGDGGHTSNLGLGLHAQATQGVRDVKRLLALDCVRELERMYAPAPASLPSEDHRTTDASMRRRRSDVPPGGSAGTRPAQGTLPHSLARPLPPLALTAQWDWWPGSARTCAPMRKAHAHASRAGADRNRGCASGSEDPTRPGTPARETTTSPALGPLRGAHAQAQHRRGEEERSAAHARPQASAGRTRLAGNFGEIRARSSHWQPDEGYEDGDGDGGAALGLAFAHTHIRARGEGKGDDRDLRRGDEDGEDTMEKQLSQQQVGRMARKDAAWYLCAVLSRLLSRGTPSNGDAATSSGSSGDANATSVPPDPSRLGADDVDVDAANATANANASPREQANHKLSLTNPDDTDTIADEAVYAALVDLLRRSRPAHSSFLPGGRGNGGRGSDPSTYARADSAEASIRDHDHVHDGGFSAEGADRHDRPHAHRDARDGDPGRGLSNGTVAMGAVERGMLLAVFERAWLGM